MSKYETEVSTTLDGDSFEWAERILILGACPNEPHIKTIIDANPETEVWTMDIKNCGGGFPRHIKKDFNDTDYGDLITIFGGQPLDLIIFDSQVIKFFDNLIRFIGFSVYKLLKPGGQIIMECCFTGHRSVRGFKGDRTPLFSYSVVYGGPVELSEDEDSSLPREGWSNALSRTRTNQFLLEKTAAWARTALNVRVEIRRGDFPISGTTDPVFTYLIITKPIDKRR